MKSIRQFNVAVKNNAAPNSLYLSNHRPINEYKHCNGSIRWIVIIGIRLQSLKFSDGPQYIDRRYGSTLVDLNVSLFRDLSFRECDIGMRRSYLYLIVVHIFLRSVCPIVAE